MLKKPDEAILQVVVPEQLKRDLRVILVREGMTLSAWIRAQMQSTISEYQKMRGYDHEA